MKFGLCIHPVARKISPAALPFFLCVAALAQSPQASKSKDPLERESAQSAVYAFLQACQAHDYDKAAKYLDLRRLPSDHRLKNGPELAQQLQQILDRDAQFDVASLSADTEGSRAVDSFTVNGQTLDLELERIKLHSGIYVWVFSSDSVERVPVDRAVDQRLARRKTSARSSGELEDCRYADLARYRIVPAGACFWPLCHVYCRDSRYLYSEPLLKRILPKANRSVLAEFVGPLAMLQQWFYFRAGMVWFEPSPKLHLYLTRALTVLFFRSPCSG